MCGILAAFGNLGKIREREFDSALNAITHRGPNDFGIQRFDDGVLGFKRLSIIDLSEKGHQPMSDATGRYWVIFNGEVYNYREIRSSLDKEGFIFKSNSDTEAILYGYIKWGSKVVEFLDGMFSFIIYDSISKEIFAARDRMGKKPLLYYKKDDLIIFFSELKQIIRFYFFEKEIDQRAISLYLTYGAIPSPLTIFKNVHQIEPGYFATVANGILSQTKYWTPRIQVDTSQTYQEALDATHDLVVASIKKRLISDVPLGAFLSGGIDSSIITAVMAQHSNDVKTFSINYSSAPESYDESYYANLIVQQYGTKHSTITVSPDDVFNDVEKIIWHMDQPSGDAINTYFVSQSASKGVTVSLSGIGGDEIFAGYSTFKFAETLSKFRTPKVQKDVAVPVAGRMFHSLPGSLQVNWKVRMLAGTLGAFPTSFDRYNLIKEIYRNNEKSRMAIDKLQYSDDIDFLKEYFDSSLTQVQQITMAEVNNYLKNTLLRDSDVMGMAYSLEIRCPFVDHNLIEFALAIPDKYKIRNMDTKIILKEAFRNYLPPEIIHRKKMGFAFPLSAWLKNGKLKELVEDCLSETSVRNRRLFNYTEIKKIKDDYFSLKKDSVQTYQYYQKVWLLVVLEIWFRQFIDQN